MRTLNVEQGTPEWHEERFNAFTASEAPAMMGASKYMTRTELLDMKKLRIIKDVDARTQELFERGHEAERTAREITARLLGEDLYPLTGIRNVDGMELLASFDGITMDDSTTFEHKLWNKELAEAIKNDDLPPHIYWQLEHQLLVAMAEQCIFVCSDGSETKREACNYFSVPARREALIAGWKQFAIDLANHVPQIAQVAAPVIVEAPASLPVIQYETTFKTNGIGLVSNLAEYKAAAMQLVEASKTRFVDDQDFAIGELRIKEFKRAEERIKHVIDSVRSETAEVYTFTQELETIASLIATARCSDAKQIKERKNEIRSELILASAQRINEYRAELDAQIPPLFLPAITAAVAFNPPQLSEAIKGLKTIASMRSKLADAESNGRQAARDRLAAINKAISGAQELLGENQHLIVQTYRHLLPLITTSTDFYLSQLKDQIRINEAAAQAAARAAAAKAEAEAKAEAARISDQPAIDETISSHIAITAEGDADEAANEAQEAAAQATASRDETFKASFSAMGLKTKSQVKVETFLTKDQVRQIMAILKDAENNAA